MDRSKWPKKWPMSLVVTLAATVAVGGFVVGVAIDTPTVDAPAADDIGTGPIQIQRRGPIPRAWLVASRADSTCWVSKPSERGFARSMNLARTSTARGRLRLDPELSRVARKQTRTMIERNLLHHTPESALRRRVMFWSILGENVGVGGTVDSLHTAFMNSPAHRDNILHRSFRHVGVGTSSAHGRLWVTVIFQASDNPNTTLPMPNC